MYVSPTTQWGCESLGSFSVETHILGFVFKYFVQIVSLRPFSSILSRSFYYLDVEILKLACKFLFPSISYPLSFTF